MKRKSGRRLRLPAPVVRLAPMLAGAAGIGAWWVLADLPAFSGRDDPIGLAGLVLGSGSFWGVFAVAGSLFGLAAIVAARVGADHRVAPLGWGAAAPLAGLLLDPFAFRSTATVLLFAGLGAGSIVAWSRLPAPGSLASGRRSPGTARQPGWLALGAGVALCLALAPVGRWGPLNGDEPHYTVMARSLVVDLDADLAADYAAERRLPWVPPGAAPHTIAGAAPGSAYSFHGYGLAFLLAPAVLVAGSLPAEAALPWFRLWSALWGGAAILVTYLLLRLHVPPARASAGALLVGLTAPLLLQAPHLFPDLPAMVLSALAWWLLLARPRWAPAAGAALAVLPWLHFKFLALFLAQLVAGGWLLLRSRPDGDDDPGPRLRAGYAGVALVGVAALSAWNRVLYGSFSLLAGAAFKEVDGNRLSLLDHLADPAGALRTGFALLVDQKDGLLIYAPHYLLAAAGGAWLWRRAPVRTFWLFVFFVAVWAPAALSQNTGLWGPPARWLVGGVWPVALLAALGAVLPWSDPSLRRVRAVLVTLGLVITTMFVAQGAAWYVGRIDTRAPALAWLGGPGLELWRLLPLWVRFESPAWPATYLGTVAAAASVLWLWRRAGAERGLDGGATRDRSIERNAALATLSACAAVVVLSLVLVPTDDPAVTEHRAYGALRAEISRLRAAHAWMHSGSIWFGGERTGRVVVSSAEPVREIELHVRAPAAMEATVALGGDRSILDLAGGEFRRLRFVPGRGTAWNGRWYYPLEVSSGGAVSATEVFGPGDERRLGVSVSFGSVGRGAREAPD